MRKTGRLVLLAILLASIIIWSALDYMSNQEKVLQTILESFLYIPLCWWIGLQYDKAKFYSEKDALTEIHNRRFVLSVFPKLCSLSERSQKSLGLLILDINDFKRINDEYGHKSGDVVLQSISRLLMKITRKSDVVARWGGDEFLIIAPFASPAGVEALIDRVQEGLRELSENIQMSVQVSIGSSIFPDDSRDLDELLQKADHKMYQVKTSGLSKWSEH